MPIYDRQTALVVVDVQNDFADPGGSLHVAGGDALLPFINQQIDRATEEGSLVVYSRDWHPPTTPHFQTSGGIWPEHCIADSWGASFYPALHVAAGAEHVLKGVGGEDGYSAFSIRHPQTGEVSATELAELLQHHGIRQVVVVGLATDYCVKETALDAARLGFDVVVLRDGVRAVDLQPGDGERAQQAVVAAGGRVE